MGFGDAFAFENASEIFAEHVAPVGVRERGQPRLRSGGVWPAPDYDESLRPASGARASVCVRSACSATGTSSPPTARALCRRGAAPPLFHRRACCVLNTGRVRDHWHTNDANRQAARLSAHMAEPFAELHPDDAASRGIRRCQPRAVLENRHGSALVQCIDQRQAAEGCCVRADALTDWSVLRRRPHRRAGHRADRSPIGSTRAQIGTRWSLNPHSSADTALLSAPASRRSMVRTTGQSRGPRRGWRTELALSASRTTGTDGPVRRSASRPIRTSSPSTTAPPGGKVSLCSRVSAWSLPLFVT